jgi:class 3 adenylate cyclase
MDTLGNILVVDDDIVYQTLLTSKLKRDGYTVTKAQNGRQALEILQSQSFDVVLLDIEMPEMDGYQVLEQMKNDEILRHIPVIVISGEEGMESVIRCIEKGALDFLPKEPFNAQLLNARINAALAAKRLHEEEQKYLTEKEKSEQLLLNILPVPIAERLKQGEEIIADSFDEVTVLFADIVGFTKLSEQLEPAELVGNLNDIFSVFDELAKEHGLEKIKTIGDNYMIVGGLPTPRPDHAEAVAKMAIDMQKGIARFNAVRGESLHIRIGMNTGPVVAGIIGTTKFSYDLWGDTVNTASRMESHGVEDGIQVTAATYERLKDKYVFEDRGIIQVKGKGEMKTYLLTGRKTS